MRRDVRDLPATGRWPLAAVLILLCALPALAQNPADPFTSAKVRVGPFAVTPTIGITDVGVDTNVYNEWGDPKSDWTATLTPAADAWLRLGKARLNTKLSASYVYFATFHKERSLNTRDSARLELPLAHLKPWAGVSYLNTRDRPGYEIDARARRTEIGFSGGVDLLLSRKTTFAVALRRNRTDFPSGESFQDIYLRDVFNRHFTVGTASLRYALTPLTTIVMSAEVERERFQFSPGRDANGLRVVPGVEFDPFALVSGSAHVGYRRLKMLTPGMPDYAGPVADVNLAYRLLGVTRFTVAVRRDVEYSYQLDEPYYVLTGVTGSITQSVGGPLAIVARAGTQRLAYRSGTPAAAVTGILASPKPAHLQAPAEAGRLDIVRLYGGGLSYKLGPDTRLGFNVDYYTRRSQHEDRQYDGLRAGTSVTYGF